MQAGDDLASRGDPLASHSFSRTSHSSNSAHGGGASASGEHHRMQISYWVFFLLVKGIEGVGVASRLVVVLGGVSSSCLLHPMCM